MRPCTCNNVTGKPYTKGQCVVCWHYYYTPGYKEQWDKPLPSNPRSPCLFLRDSEGSVSEEQCGKCPGNVRIKVYRCSVHGLCTLGQQLPGKACCTTCKDYRERGEVIVRKPIVWSYGITTIPERRTTYLPQTIQSLALAGFDKPWLFVDGCNDASEYRKQFPGVAGVTTRPYPPLRTHGNFVLSLLELFIREPSADRYAVFQDDFVTYRNLRQYLECCNYPDRGYWNLYTFPVNDTLCPTDVTGKRIQGWYLSNQSGRGAVALIFDRVAAIELIASRHMAERPMDPLRGHRAVDGGIVTGLAKAGWQEYVHNPSLVQHIGQRSSIGNNPHPQATSFRGDSYDAMDMMRANSVLVGR